MSKRKTKELYDSVMSMYNGGKRICDIMLITGLPRSCISNWVLDRIKIYKDDYIKEKTFDTYCKISTANDYYDKIKSLTLIKNVDEMNACYSYLFGLYLGDGISRDSGGKSYFISYALDCKYMDLINFTKNNVYKFFGKEPHLYDKRNYKFVSNSFDVKLYYKPVRPFFPQSEEYGPKHLRKITIEDWQHEILNPLECLRGLIYSDGSFCNSNSYKTFKYEFCNCSSDIIEFFKFCCDKLNIRYNVHQKKTATEKTKALKYNVSIGYQDDVRWLMKRIGYKTQINHKLNIKNSEGYYQADENFVKQIYDNLPEKMKPDFDCSICKKECFTDDSNNFYLNDKLWLSINKNRKTGMICLDCVEKFLGRDLTTEDLKDENVNKFLNPTIKQLYK